MRTSRCVSCEQAALRAEVARFRSDLWLVVHTIRVDSMYQVDMDVSEKGLGATQPFQQAQLSVLFREQPMKWDTSGDGSQRLSST